ncbi:uncharacterized protein LOC128683859 [Plodia interpunctella]|uniref:uncharacterized protein LOC128683859 n=1 Tax=Plodia interpunctella TaxID=58824 RepID=UPI0023677AD1|nr:uncharacterized protein LOC128683859 [Plodia interpunctella]
MFKYARTLFCAFLLIALFDPSKGARGFGGRHSYPSSRGGLSGGGHHSYPSSGGLSGSGHRPPSHGYPSSGGLSGGGGGHSYPGSTGLSGSGSQGHKYPNSGYKPNSPSHTSTHTTINNHYHYNYNPPQQIRYTSSTGVSNNFPVYHSPPPTYVYQYKDSGSKYGTLLAGLALLNLGVLGAGVYANSQSHKTYQTQPGEVCKFGLRKDNGDYEETRIDCQIISSYIFQYQATSTTASPNAQGNMTVVTVTVTNTTTVNNANPVGLMGGEVMLPNGTLIATNVTGNAVNSTSTSSVTTTTTNTTTVNALEVKGKPIEVTPQMKCYVMKTSPTSNMKMSVDCGLLQAYAVQSLKKNSAIRHIPTFTVLTAILAAFVIY